jgi:exosortase
MISSSLAEHALAAVRIPVLREGNVIMLPEVTLDVTDACSGIRSLVSLTALGVLYAYLTDRRLWVRALLVSATLPIAVIANALRVSGTAMAAEFYGLDAAMGFFHTFSGLLLFVAAFSGLWVLHGSVSLVGRWRSAVPRTAV